MSQPPPSADRLHSKAGDHTVVHSAGRPDAPSVPNRILAIDGPAGAGKSTIASQMARRFLLLNLETGAMYRAFALKSLAHKVSLEDADSLEVLSRTTKIDLIPSPHGNRVLLDGEDVTDRLRTPLISEAASRVSVHGPVRSWMVGLQQALGAKLPAGAAGLVMEGRDIGTVVFPQASIKVFLSASAEARTQRRLAQSENTSPTLNTQAEPLSAKAEAVLAAIRERDARDQSRAESPLRPAEDAVHIDSTHLDLDTVVAQVASLVSERWGL
jgi:cytidylate kinase